MSDQWSERRLGDVLEIKHGFAFLGEYFSDSGTHVVLTPGNFFDEGGFKTKAEEKWYCGPINADYILSEGDLLVAMTEQAEGLLGSSALVPHSNLYLHNQRLGLVKVLDPDENDKRFLYYLFNSKGVRGQIRASASGTKVRHTSPSRIYDVVARFPRLKDQQRIAEVLLAYDELIRNCRQRIEALEEIARAIYREWFIDFNFPGAKDTALVTSELGMIPVGWSVKKLGDLFDLTMGQSPESKFYNYAGDGLPFHQGISNFGYRFPVDRVFCNADGRIAESGDILFSVRAPVGRMNICQGKMILGRGLASLRNRSGAQAFSWEQLRNRFTRDDMIGNGSIFASVTKADMKSIPFVCPPDELVAKAQVHLEPIHAQIALLDAKNVNLRKTSDMLLPRLVSGQLKLDVA